MAPGGPDQLTFEQTVNRIVELAAERGGTVGRADIEADAALARDRSLTSAAGHSLAGGTNVAASAAEGGWFPYERLSFGSLPIPDQPGARGRR
jgi:hypothetical protein